MSRARTLLTGMSTLALIAAFSTPGFAAKSMIADEEMDQVTAAGEPKIAMVSKSASGQSLYAKNEQLNWFSGVIQSGSQDELRAITLNNIFGENQTATAVNISAGDGGQADGSSQANTINQSWGSAKAVPGKSVDGVASYGDNNSKVKQANLNAQLAANLAQKNVAVEAENENTQRTVADVNQVQNHAAKQGVLSAMWMFADEIASVDQSAAAGDVYATNYVDTSITGVIEEGSQNSISALTVNNVFGLNQTATALNIVSGEIGFSPLNIGAADGASANSQSNTINQYRGTPIGWTDAPVFSN
jgi:hypothetical protein